MHLYVEAAIMVHIWTVLVINVRNVINHVKPVMVVVSITVLVAHPNIFKIKANVNYVINLVWLVMEPEIIVV